MKQSANAGFAIIVQKHFFFKFSQATGSPEFTSPQRIASSGERVSDPHRSISDSDHTTQCVGDGSETEAGGKVYMVMVNFQVQYRPRNMHRRGGRKDWGGVSGYVGKERGLGEGKRERGEM